MFGVQNLLPQGNCTRLLAPKSIRILNKRIETRIVAQSNKRPPQQPPQNNKQLIFDRVIILGSAVTLSAAVVALTRLASSPTDEFDTFSSAIDVNTGILGLSLTSGDFVGSLLWALSLYYASPIQQLLLFLGKIETERPSDWVIKQFGLAAGLDVDAVDYSAPIAIRAATIILFLLSGFAVSIGFEALLEDPTWSVSTGIGSCLAAGLYEVGRPERLSPEEAQRLELQWQDFAKFANSSLQRGGRCHESEIFRKFRGKFPRYESDTVLSDSRLRDMVRNWHPEAERSSQGYYKNVSIRPRDDVHTSSSVGSLNSAASLGSGSVLNE